MATPTWISYPGQPTINLDYVYAISHGAEPLTRLDGGGSGQAVYCIYFYVKNAYGRAVTWNFHDEDEMLRAKNGVYNHISPLVRLSRFTSELDSQ
jgi:hypothetical protein